MFARFVADFIQKCISEGINKPADMRSKARKELKLLQAQIDTKKSELDRLETNKKEFQAAIINLGGNANNDDTTMVDWTTPFGDCPEDFRELLFNICDEIEQTHPRGVKPSRIVHELASLENHKHGYGAIKWLGYRKIIDRDPDDRSVIMGPSWGERPTR